MQHFAGDVLECYATGTKTKPHINEDAVRLIKQIYVLLLLLLMRQWGDKPKLMFFMLNGIKISQRKSRVSVAGLLYSKQEEGIIGKLG